MRLPKILIILAVPALAACVPGSPIYIGAGFANIRGTLFALEDMQPIPGAEVCIFGSDTTCVRTGPDGNYRTTPTKPGIVTIRFRLTGARPAAIEGFEIFLNQDYQIDCVMSTRMTLSTETGSCREDHLPTEN
jgi:hypothetical protein